MNKKFVSFYLTLFYLPFINKRACFAYALVALVYI